MVPENTYLEEEKPVNGFVDSATDAQPVDGERQRGSPPKIRERSSTITIRLRHSRFEMG